MRPEERVGIYAFYALSIHSAHETTPCINACILDCAVDE